MDANAQEAAEWLAQIAALMARDPNYQFIFIMATPQDDSGVLLAQISNSNISGVAWMLNVASMELMRRTQDDLNG